MERCQNGLWMPIFVLVPPGGVLVLMRELLGLGGAFSPHVILTGDGFTADLHPPDPDLGIWCMVAYRPPVWTSQAAEVLYKTRTYGAYYKSFVSLMIQARREPVHDATQPLYHRPIDHRPIDISVSIYTLPGEEFPGSIKNWMHMKQQQVAAMLREGWQWEVRPWAIKETIYHNRLGSTITGGNEAQTNRLRSKYED